MSDIVMFEDYVDRDTGKILRRLVPHHEQMWLEHLQDQIKRARREMVPDFWTPPPLGVIEGEAAKQAVQVIEDAKFGPGVIEGEASKQAVQVIEDAKFEKAVRQLRDLLRITGEDPATNTDQYHRGCYNGLELALATLENREPVYREAPAAPQPEPQGEDPMDVVRAMCGDKRRSIW
jgi:hypothetical protein